MKESGNIFLYKAIRLTQILYLEPHPLRNIELEVTVQLLLLSSLTRCYLTYSPKVERNIILLCESNHRIMHYYHIIIYRTSMLIIEE